VKIKISATFEGKCNICGKEGKVFSIGDEDTKKVLTICEDCAKRFGEMQASDAIEQFGHEDEKPFKEGIRFEKSMGG